MKEQRKGYENDRKDVVNEVCIVFYRNTDDELCDYGEHDDICHIK